MHRFVVAVVFVLVAGFFQTGSGETTCESHREVADGSRAVEHQMQWNITCDAQGNYYPSLQCTINTPKWCACYNEEVAVSQPSRRVKTCECPIKKDEATRNDPTNVCAIPKCERSGQFEKKQCCTTTQKCHCVDPITGQKTSEPTSDMNLQCQ